MVLILLLLLLLLFTHIHTYIRTYLHTYILLHILTDALDASLDNYDKSLQARLVEEVEGKLHPDVPITLHNMAHVLQKQGKWSEAIQYYRDSLSLNKEIHGNEHYANQLMKLKIKKCQQLLP